MATTADGPIVAFRDRTTDDIRDIHVTRVEQGKWTDAKKSWEEYAQFLSTHPGVKGYAPTATERVKVVDARADLDAKYAPVRQRIEQRQKENASPPAAAEETPPPPPAAPAKKK